MAWNTKPIKKTNDEPMGQHYSELIGDYEPTYGRNNAAFTELVDTTGTPIDLKVILQSAFGQQSSYNSSVGAILTTTLDTGEYGGRTVLEVWVKSNAAATFTVFCSRNNADWRQVDTIVLNGAGEEGRSYTNSYRYIKVSTSQINDNETEIVSSR